MSMRPMNAMQAAASSSKKLNAAGLTPDHSLILPERAPAADENEVLQALVELYTSSLPTEAALRVFATQAVLTLSTGDVVVGPGGIGAKFNDASATHPHRSVQQRLLQTPESLPARTMCIDQIVTLHQNGAEAGTVGTGAPGSHSVRNLIVLKRRATDGLVTSMTEEEGHRRATAQLAARAAASGNFYSPTDNMVSPCTSKLNLAKKKHHLKGTPRTLFASQLANKQPQGTGADMDMA